MSANLWCSFEKILFSVHFFSLVNNGIELITACRQDVCSSLNGVGASCNVFKMLAQACFSATEEKVYPTGWVEHHSCCECISVRSLLATLYSDSSPF